MARSVEMPVSYPAGDFASYAKFVKPRILDALAVALTEELQLAFRQSQREIPVKTGTAKMSGVLKPATVEGDVVTGSYGYGGAASAYVRRLNDDRSLNHPNGGKAGFVEDPLRARIPTMPEALAARLAKALKR